MAQRNIDFGTFPNDPDADAIRTAFQKAQENFTELFAGIQEQAVLTVSGLPGGGITAFPSTGNVVLTANLACLQVRTSTLSIGRDANGSQSAVITQSSQELWVDLPANIVNVANANFTGTVYSNAFVANNSISSSNTISATGNITGGNLNTSGVLVVTGNANVGNIGAVIGVFTSNVTVANNISASNVWANSGTITSANANITSNLTSGNANLGNLAKANYFQGDGYLLSNVTAAPGNIIINGTSQVFATLNGNVTTTAAGYDVLVVTTTGVNVAGYGNFTGNVSAANANLGNAVTANYFIGNFYGTANSATTATTATTAGTVTTNAQPNITSVGTLSALSVTGKVTAGQLQGDGGNISNIQGANVSGAVASATSATTATSATSATTAGTVTTNAQPNITSVGTLSSLTVTSNVTAGNLIGILANGNSNISIPAANGNINISAGGTTNELVITSTGINVAGTLNATGNANVGNLGTTTAVITTGNITTINSELMQNGNSNVTITANANVTINAVGGARITATSTGANVTGTLGVSGNANVGNLGTAGLVTATGNVSGGNLTTGGALSVTGNANVGNLGTAQVLATANITAPQLISNVAIGTAPFVVTSTTTVANLSVANATFATSAGSATTAGTVTTNAQPNITSVGTLSNLVVTANVTAGNVYANSGTIGASLLTGTLTTASQPNITSVGTLTSLGVNGTVTAVAFTANTGVFTGNGNGLSSIVGANVTGTVSSATTAGTVTTNAQPNITSVGTLSALSVTGNISSGNANLGNLATANFFQGDGSLLTNISVGAGSYIVNGNSNVTIDADANVRISSAGNANVLVVTGSGANITGTANITGNVIAAGVYATLLDGTLTSASNAQPNITSIGTLTALNVNGLTNLGPNGNITITGGVNGAFLKTNGSGNLTWDTATLVPAQGANTQVIFNDGGSTYAGNANLTFNKTTGNLSVGGGLSVVNSATFGNVYANSGTVRGSLLTGTLTTAAQPNITSVGSLSSLIVSGNINSGNVSGGNVVSANYFTGNHLVLAAGTHTSQLAVANLTQTWNNSSVVFTAEVMNITDTASAAGSKLLDLQVGSVTKFSVDKGGVIFGNGSSLTAIPGANVTGTVANATFATSAGSATTATSATTAGTVTTNAQPNITSVGTLTGLTVNGLVTSTRSTINYGTATSNVHALTVLQTWNNASAQFSAIEANIIDTTSAANSLLIDLQISSVSKFAVSKEGNVFFSGTVTGNGAGLSAIAGSNVTGTVPSATNATAVLTNTSTATTVYLAGTSTAANSHTSLEKVTGIYANMANNAITATTFVGSLSGAATSAGSATTAGTVTTNAQPNITSVGTLTALTVTNKVTAGQLQGEGGNISNIQGANVSGAVASATNATAVLTNTSTATTVYLAGTSTAANAQASLEKVTGIYANMANNAITATTFVGTLSGAATSATSATNASALLQNTSSATTVYPTFSTSGANGNSSAVVNTNISANLANASITATTFVGALSGAATSATTAGTVTTAAQPNITSVTTSGGTFVIGNTSNGGIQVNRGEFVFNSYTGAAEGAQFVLAWPGTSGISGQANSTWNMDVNASNNYRIFYQNATGVTGTPLTAYSANADILTGGNLTTTGYRIRSVTTGISAAGTTQGTATAITKEMNVVSTVASGAGVILPTAVAGMAITITNLAANALLVYPHSTGDINGAAANVAYSHSAGATLQYIAPTTTDWYTVGATFA